MSTYNNQILFAIVAACIVFTLLVSLVGVLLFFHKQKVNRLDMEKEIMHAEYQQTLMQTQLEIQEETFNNISREIHDNVGQLLSLAKVQLNIAEQTHSLEKNVLYEVKQNIGQSLFDLRDIAKSLSGENMMQMGFGKTVQQEVDRLNRSKVIQATLLSTGEEKKLSDRNLLIAVRILQESLQNIIKHANASNVSVTIQYLPAIVEMLITDNGKGFSTEATMKTPSGLGIQNIIKRAAIVGGHATIKSIINTGTEVKLVMPYE